MSAAASWGPLLSLTVLLLTGSCVPNRPAAAPTPPPTPHPTPPPVAQPGVPRRIESEVRGVWVSNTQLLDWDSATRELQRAGYNTMYVNLASGGAAFYPSALVTAVAGIAGDPVGRGIALAHQRGLAVHAKLIATFMFKTSPEFQGRLRAADRVMRGPTGQPIEQAGFFWLCPTHASNRSLLKALTAELVGKYPVDGLQLDYIRFCEQPSCYCATCRREFERVSGAPVHNWPADVIQGNRVAPFRAWQIGVINDLLREITTTARGTRPGLWVSAAVFPDLNRAREEKAQDWKAWLDRGYVDYVCGMNYTTNLADFEANLIKQQAWTERRKVVVGIGSWKFERLDGVHAEIAAARRLGAPGFALFSYDDAAARGFLPVFAISK